MKIMLLGDTHGSLPHLELAARTAAENGCEKLVQVGDWGYSFNRSGLDKRIAEVSRIMRKYSLEHYFLDGNHDNFSDLEERGLLDADEPVEYADRITYLPRGARWEWEGVSFLSLGGAVSIDKRGRTRFVSWWAEEEITWDQALKAMEGGPVDVMLAHDCPSGIPHMERYLQAVSDSGILNYKIDNESKNHRSLLRAVVDEVKPKLYVHGHFHHRYDSHVSWDQPERFLLPEGPNRIVGLDRDGTGPSSWIIFDLPNITTEVFV